MAFNPFAEDEYEDREYYLAQVAGSVFQVRREEAGMVHAGADTHERNAQLLMDQAARELEMAEKARQLLERFGEFDDFEDDAVILWKRRFNDYGRQYTYTALKAGCYWWISGTNRGASKFSHERLIAEHLSRADEVWMVTKWEQL